jgi:hypothetical protein
MSQSMTSKQGDWVIDSVIGLDTGIRS